jgi:hypothetical protein
VDTNKWDNETVKVQLALNPFAEGALRAAYHGIIYFNPSNDPNRKFQLLNVVLKVSKKDQPKEIYTNDVEMQM